MIYLIETEQWAGEDYNGRDLYDSVIDPDLGYFKTRESAQEKIVKLCTPSEKVFKVNEAQRKREWERDKKAWDERLRTIQVLTDAGLPVRNLPWASNPGEFTAREFDPTPRGMESFSIVEVHPG